MAETTFFDASSYTDLQTFFEAEPHHQQQLHSNTQILTQEETERLEWTYLEPVKPVTATTVDLVAGSVISSARTSHDLDSIATTPSTPPAGGQWTDAGPAVIVKAEPMTNSSYLD